MKKIYFILAFLAFSQPCLAVDNISSSDKHHILSLNKGIGSIQTNLFSEEGQNAIISGVFYDYQYDSNWTLGTGLIVGEGVDFCIITCFRGDEASYRTIDFNSYILTIKGSSPLTNRWSMFAELGVNHYNSKFSGAYRDNVTNSGIGALLATGFDFRTYSGFGLGFETTWLGMGDINTKSFTINLSYMF